MIINNKELYLEIQNFWLTNLRSFNFSKQQKLLLLDTLLEIDKIKDERYTEVIKVVDSLPTDNYNQNTIYLIPSVNASDQNGFTEYVFVNGSPERIGFIQTDVNFDNYYTKTDVDNFIQQLTNTVNTHIELYTSTINSITSALEIIDNYITSNNKNISDIQTELSSINTLISSIGESLTSINSSINNNTQEINNIKQNLNSMDEFINPLIKTDESLQNQINEIVSLTTEEINNILV